MEKVALNAEIFFSCLSEESGLACVKKNGKGDDFWEFVFLNTFINTQSKVRSFTASRLRFLRVFQEMLINANQEHRLVFQSKFRLGMVYMIQSYLGVRSKLPL